MCSQTVVKTEQDRSIGSFPSYTVHQPAKDHQKKRKSKTGVRGLCDHSPSRLHRDKQLVNLDANLDDP